MNDFSNLFSQLPNTNPTLNNERINEIKAMISFHSRIHDRIKKDRIILAKNVERLMDLLDNTNKIYNSSIKYYGNNSPVASALNSCSNSPNRAQSVLYSPNQQFLDYQENQLTKPYDQKRVIFNLINTKDFDFYFLGNPILPIALFDSHEFIFDSLGFSKEVEKYSHFLRNMFFSSFFRHINETSQVFRVILGLVEEPSFSALTEKIESKLPPILNCKRCTFFKYDEVSEELIFDRGNLYLKRHIKEGVIFSSLQNNSIVIVDDSSSSLSNLDKSIIHKNHSMLVIPINKKGIVLLFDKQGSFMQYDLIMAKSIQLFVSQAIPTITQKLSISNFYPNDLKSFLFIDPEFIAKRFQCEYVRVFKLCNKGLWFSDISTKENSQELFPITCGIVGQTIIKRHSICIHNPEFSVLFHESVDRAIHGIVTRSILVCPIFTEHGKAKWVISLYNRIGLDNFTSDDQKSFNLLCYHMNPILRAQYEANKLSKHLQKKLRALGSLSAVSDLFMKLEGLNDLTLVSNSLSKHLEEALGFCSVELFYIDRLRSYLVSSDLEFDQKIQKNSEYPVCVYALGGKAMERPATEGFGASIIFPFCDSFGNTIGVAKLEFESDNKKNNNIASIYTSTHSIFSNRTSSSKSLLQEKVKKMNTVLSTHYEEVEDSHAHRVLQMWKSFLGPLFESSLSLSSLNNGLKYFHQVSLLNNPWYLYIGVSHENEKLGSETTIPIVLPTKSMDFIQKSQQLINNLDTYHSYPHISVISNSSENSPYFSNTNPDFGLGFNVFAESPDSLLLVASIIISRVFKTEPGKAVYLARSIRYHHVDTWERAIDNAHFALYVLNHLSLPLNTERSQALILHLLSSQCIISNETNYLFEVENSSVSFYESPFLYCLSKSEFNLFDGFETQTIIKIFNEIQEYQIFDSFSVLDSKNILMIISTLSKYSYLSRQKDISERAFNQIYSNPNTKKIHLEIEYESIIKPLFNTLTSLNFPIKNLEETFETNIIHILTKI